MTREGELEALREKADALQHEARRAREALGRQVYRQIVLYIDLKYLEYAFRARWRLAYGQGSEEDCATLEKLRARAEAHAGRVAALLGPENTPPKAHFDANLMAGREAKFAELDLADALSRTQKKVDRAIVANAKAPQRALRALQALEDFVGEYRNGEPNAERRNNFVANCKEQGLRTRKALALAAEQRLPAAGAPATQAVMSAGRQAREDQRRKELGPLADMSREEVVEHLRGRVEKARSESLEPHEKKSTSGCALATLPFAMFLLMLAPA